MSEINSEKIQNIYKEANDYFLILKDLKENKWANYGNDDLNQEKMYILDKKWLRKWKEYVNWSYIKSKNRYNYYYSTQITQYEINEKAFPGEISNNRILVPISQFLNNGDLLDNENIVIRSDINQREDVKICTFKIWEFFYNKYGGGPIIERTWIPEEGAYSSKVVELFYRSLNIIFLPCRKSLSKDIINTFNQDVMYISRTKSLSDLKKKYLNLSQKYLNNLEIKIFQNDKIPTPNIRLWKLDPNSSLEKFKNFLIDNLNNIITTNSLIKINEHLSYIEYLPNIILKDLEFSDTDVCIAEYFDQTCQQLFEVEKVEIKEGKCEFCSNHKMLRYPCSCKDVWYCTENCFTRDSVYHLPRCKQRFSVEENSLKFNRDSKKGLVGLQNLGNTCFMNTSLQCISNCYELTNYFLNDKYKSHINLENPIGTQGLLARAYSNLLKNLWFGSYAVYSPWNFKSAISSFQSMFTGYQQHDTQEFLNYLLDGLHEDLNKVHLKPLVEKDDCFKEDVVKSKEQWIGFLRRNQSVLVDLLYGQYKSTLYCPRRDCLNISTTFDPFLSISLPIAKSNEKYEVSCFFIFYDIQIIPIHISLIFYSETTVMAYRNKLGKLLTIHPFSFIIIKMDSCGDIEQIINSSMPLNMKSNKICDSPFFCFQIDPNIFYTVLNTKLNDISLHLSEKIINFNNTLNTIEQTRDQNNYLFEEGYQEDTTGQTTDSLCYYSKILIKKNGDTKPAILKINTDNNNGFNDDWIKMLIYIKKYEDFYSESRKKLNFTRVIFINKKWSTKQLHLTILNYFSNILDKFYNKHSNRTIDDLWETFFPDLYENTLLNQNQHKSRLYPYLIRINNIFTEIGGYCIFCDNRNCNDCLLPCSETMTVGDLLNKIPNKEGLQIDNSYFYLNEKQRRICSSKETDFKIEVCWLNQYHSEVKKLNEKHDFEIKSLKDGPKCIDIYHCFKNFVKIEKLEEDNKWYCSKCKQHQQADKKMEIYKSPNILIIHLKRFKNNSKIDNLVQFPIENLDISEYVINHEGLPLVYDLFAIANHYGGLGGGHYVAYAQNHLDKSWYCYNDSSVSKISIDKLVSSGAYVLFYKRQNLHKLINMEEIYNNRFHDYEIISDVKMKNLNINESLKI